MLGLLVLDNEIGNGEDFTTILCEKSFIAAVTPCKCHVMYVNDDRNTQLLRKCRRGNVHVPPKTHAPPSSTFVIEGNSW